MPLCLAGMLCTMEANQIYNLTPYSGYLHIVLQVQDESGKTITGMYEWSSLTRAQTLLVLQHLPSKLGGLFPEPNSSKIGALLKVERNT